MRRSSSPPVVSDSGLKLGRVSGEVTYKGQPVRGGIVSFLTDQSKGTVCPPASGALGFDGSYAMSTNSSGDGAIVGHHRIVGVDPNPVAGADTIESRTKHKDNFTDRAGQKYRYVVPRKFSDPEQSGIIAKVDRGSNTLNIVIEENGTARINP